MPDFTSHVKMTPEERMWDKATEIVTSIWLHSDVALLRVAGEITLNLQEQGYLE